MNEESFKSDLIREVDSLIALLEDVSTGRIIDTICIYKSSKIIWNLKDIRDFISNQSENDISDSLNIIERAANQTGVEQQIQSLVEDLNNLSNLLTIVSDETSEKLDPLIKDLINILSDTSILDQFQAKMDEFSDAVEDIKRNEKEDDFELFYSSYLDAKLNSQKLNLVCVVHQRLVELYNKVSKLVNKAKPKANAKKKNSSTKSKLQKESPKESSKENTKESKNDSEVKMEENKKKQPENPPKQEINENKNEQSKENITNVTQYENQNDQEDEESLPPQTISVKWSIGPHSKKVKSHHNVQLASISEMPYNKSSHLQIYQRLQSLIEENQSLRKSLTRKSLEVDPQETLNLLKENQQLKERLRYLTAQLKSANAIPKSMKK